MFSETKLVGNTGRDVEVRTTQDGKLIGHLSVATSKSWKDRNSGEKKTKTTWHRVTIFREQTVKFLQQYVPTGSLVMVIGELSYGSYTDGQGVERATTEIHVGGYSGTVLLLRGKDRQAETPHDPETGEVRGAAEAAQLDDEIPF